METVSSVSMSSGVAPPPQGLKRKLDSVVGPLGSSPPEPGQVLQEEDTSKKFKIRVRISSAVGRRFYLSGLSLQALPNNVCVCVHVLVCVCEPFQAPLRTEAAPLWTLCLD